MTACLYCIDNDIIQKLATFELFDETIALFKASRNEINILDTAKYKFRGDLKAVKKGRSIRPETKFVNYEKTIELAETLPQIGRAMVEDSLFQRLSRFENVDPGEATLTAYVAKVLVRDDAGDAFIITGDKRYLRAFSLVDLPDMQALFVHRFWCLEQLVLRNIRQYGFATVRDKIVPTKDCDQACKVVFGSGELSTEENSVAAIISYIKTLREETGDLLHPYPG